MEFDEIKKYQPMIMFYSNLCMSLTAFGVQMFWLVYKWDLVPIENTFDIIGLAFPFLILYIVAILLRMERFRVLLHRIEFIFHILTAIGYSLLLLLLQFRNEFDMFLPLAYPFFLWNFILGLHLISILLVYSRLKGEWTVNESNIKFKVVVFATTWIFMTVFLFILEYPIYYWLISIPIHSYSFFYSYNQKDIVPIDEKSYTSLRDMIIRRSSDPDHKKKSFTSILQEHSRVIYLAIVFIFGWNQWAFHLNLMGSIENNFPTAMGAIISPFFFVGAFLAIIQNHRKLKSQKTLYKFSVDGCLVVITALSMLNVHLMAPISIGYSLLSLITLLKQKTETSFASSLILIIIAWIAGLYVFTFHGMMLNLADTILYMLSLDIDAGNIFLFLIFTICLLILYLLSLGLYLFDKFLKSRGQKRREKLKVSSFRRDLSFKRSVVYSILLLLSITGSLCLPLFALGADDLKVHTNYETNTTHELEDYWGIALAPINSLSEMNKTGAHWTRIHITWKRVEPSDGVWDFSYYDDYLSNASFYGIKVMAMLSHRAPWVEDLGENYISHDNVPDFLDFANETIDRYSSDVEAWEIWNEPNLERFWDGPMDDYYYLFNETVEFIHKEYPTLYIVGSSFSAASAGYIPPDLENMFAMGIMNHIDAVSVHYYNYDPDTLYAALLQYINVGERYGFNGDYLVTEIGHPTSGGYPHLVNENELADSVIKSLVISSAYNIRTFLWYCMRDSGDIDDPEADIWNSERWFGLHYNNLTRKKGAYAFNLFSDFCSNGFFIADMIDTPSNFAAKDLMVSLYNRSDNLYTIIMWYAPTLHQSGAVNVEIEFNNDISNLTLHNIYDGTNLTLMSAQFRVSNEPIMITFKCDDFSRSVSLTVNGFYLGEITYAGFLFTVLFSIVFVIKNTREESLRKTNKE